MGLGLRGTDEIYLRNVSFEMAHFDPRYLPAEVDQANDEAVARAIWDLLAEDPSLAVISADRLGNSDDGGFNFGPQRFTVDGDIGWRRSGDGSIHG